MEIIQQLGPNLSLHLPSMDSQNVIKILILTDIRRKIALNDEKP